jgi:hypothetical protein
MKPFDVREGLGQNGRLHSAIRRWQFMLGCVRHLVTKLALTNLSSLLGFDREGGRGTSQKTL